MGVYRTRGQAPAVDAVRVLLDRGMPQTLLLVGPASVGKTTLALDIAAALLCTAADPSDRPCRACRSCRFVDSGNHPDVHRLAPEGPAGEIRIGPVRGLIRDLALRPAEGGARVALIERAHRLNDDAQNALLKLLEEPGEALTIVLAADDEDALLPTVRSRAARLRLGPVATADIGDLLVEVLGADRPLATRIARIADGRAGLAVAYASSSDAVAVRQELSRALLDLIAAPRATRLVSVRDHLKRAGQLAKALAGPAERTEPAGGAPRGRGGRTRGNAPGVADAVASPPAADAPAEEGGGEEGEGGAGRTPAADRRRAAQTLVDVWRDTARDLLLIDLGEPRALREPDLLEELEAAARLLRRADLASFLMRLDRIAAQLETNAYPELAVDVLALAVPSPGRRAA